MEKNIALTGNQSRILIELMIHPNVMYKGSQLIDAATILQQLLEISQVQPAELPVAPPKAS